MSILEIILSGLLIVVATALAYIAYKISSFKVWR